MLLQTHKNQVVDSPCVKDTLWSRFRHLLPAGIMLSFLVGGLLAATLSGSGQGDGYMVVGPPGWTQGRTTGLVRASGGRLVRAGGFANVVIAASPDPDFARVLEAAGALLVRPVSGPLGCLVPEQQGQSR